MDFTKLGKFFLGEFLFFRGGHEAVYRQEEEGRSFYVSNERKIHNGRLE